MKDKRVLWLDGLKGLACMMVFWGHLYLVYVEESSVALEQIHPGVIAFCNIANVLINGNLGVCLFCMISGYLASKKKIDNFKELGKAILLRYLKFVSAFLAMAILIVVIGWTIGYPTVQWGNANGNVLITGFYNRDFSIVDYLGFVFLFQPALNMPLWTIAPIFLGNVLIYVMNFLLKKSPEWVKVVVSLIFVVFGMICGYPGYGYADRIILYTGAAFMGIIMPYIWQVLAKVKDWILILLLACAIIGVSGGYRYVISYVSRVIYVPEVFYSDIYWYLVLGIVILALIGGSECLHRILQSNFSLKLNELSFPVYLIHWPILCSVGLMFHGFLNSRLSATMVLALSAIFMHLLVLALAWGYLKTWQRWSEGFLKR